MSSDAHLLTDLALDLGDHRIRLLSGRDNLQQAIVMRLLTPVGELAGLGHADYGSRLFDLVGRVNTDTTRNLVRLYILESLQQEPRIGKINRIDVRQVERQPSLVSVELDVTPIASTDVISIGPFTISLI